MERRSRLDGINGSPAIQLACLGTSTWQRTDDRPATVVTQIDPVASNEETSRIVGSSQIFKCAKSLMKRLLAAKRSALNRLVTPAGQTPILLLSQPPQTFRGKIHDQISNPAHRGEVATDSMPLYNRAEGGGAKVTFVECSQTSNGDPP